MDENTLNAFKTAKIRANALKSVGKYDDGYIVDSIINLPNLPEGAKKILKDAKVTGNSTKAIQDILALPVDATTNYGEQDFQNKGPLQSAARFLGIEKAGRFIGSKIASLSPEYRENVDVAKREGVLSETGADQLSRGGVSNRELVGSLGNVALNVALPFAGKALSTGSAAARIAKAGATGAAFGTTGGLNEGKEGVDLAESAVLGGALGAGTAGLLMGGGKLLEGFKNYRKQLAGISPQTENILKELPDATKLDKYIGAAKARSLNIRESSPLGLAAEELETAGSEIQKQIKKAGSAVGQAKISAGSKRLADVSDVIDDFRNAVAEKFGMNLSIKKGAVSTRVIPGSLREVSGADRKRIATAFKQLVKLQKNGTVKGSSDVLHNLDDLVDYTKTDQFGVNRDPLEAIFKMTRGKLNDAVRTAAPKLAEANDKFSQLKSVEKFIASTAGKDLGRGELLLRRVFSGDKSREALDVLEQIKTLTGKDLVQDAVLARLAIEQFGDKTQKTLLQQAIEGGVEGAVQGGLVGLAGKGFRSLIGAGADAEKIANQIIGKAPSTRAGRALEIASRGAGKARRTLSPVVRQTGYNVLSRTLGAF